MVIHHLLPIIVFRYTSKQKDMLHQPRFTDGNPPNN